MAVKRSIDWTFWRGAVARGDVTFLVGAGISSDGPSGLPLAAGLVRQLVTPLTEGVDLPSKLIQEILDAVSGLRPELLADVLLQQAGRTSLRPLDAILRSRPNAWHHFLAVAMGRGCNVVTPNFDILIEQACRQRRITFKQVVTRTETRSLAARQTAARTLFKVHGSLSDKSSELTPLMLALQQVGAGLRRSAFDALRLLTRDRPIVIVGYAGRDDFDLVPALRRVDRSAPALWIAHDDCSLRLLQGSDDSWAPGVAARHCCETWPNAQIVRGRSRVVLRALGAVPRQGVERARRPPVRPTVARGRSIPPVKKLQALVYALIECRATSLAAAVVDDALRGKHLAQKAVVMLMRDKAVVLEKEGADFKAAQRAADAAVRLAKRLGHSRALALALDERGVIARRRGQHKNADKFYRAALRALRGRRPAWLYMQIRAHHGVALDYLKQYRAALREHLAVAAFERRRADLRGLVMSLNNIGIVYESLDRPDQAIDYFNQSIAIKTHLGDFRGIAQSLHNIGRLQYRRKRYDQALDAFSESLRLRIGIAKDHHGAAQSHVALGRVAQKQGRFEDAERWASQAHLAMLKMRDSRGIEMAQTLLRELRSAPNDEMDRGGRMEESHRVFGDAHLHLLPLGSPVDNA